MCLRLSSCASSTGNPMSVTCGYVLISHGAWHMSCRTHTGMCVPCIALTRSAGLGLNHGNAWLVCTVLLALAGTLNYGNIWRQNMGVLWPPFNRRVLLQLAGSTAKSGAKKLPSLTGNLRPKSMKSVNFHH